MSALRFSLWALAVLAGCGTPANDAAVVPESVEDGSAPDTGGTGGRTSGAGGAAGARDAGGKGGSAGADGGVGGAAPGSGGAIACDASIDVPDSGGARSGNPVLNGWYADPDARVFGNRYYIYPTYSAPYGEQTFFEAFSSPDLLHWTNEGRILELGDVSWSTNRAAWAPAAASRNGKYYFYFAAGDGAGIGVAVSSSPSGPFQDALGKPLIGGFQHGAQPIDPYVYVDDDERAYLYWGGWSHLAAAELGADMTSLATSSVELTPPGYVEGPVMLKREGTYYLMWSEGNWGDSSYSAAYATGTAPLGPFTKVGKFLQTDNAVGTGPGHNSVLNVPCTDEWYVVYHRHPIGDGDNNHRVTCIDRLVFNQDGSIAPVVLTMTGVDARPL